MTTRTRAGAILCLGLLAMGLGGCAGGTTPTPSVAGEGRTSPTAGATSAPDPTGAETATAPGSDASGGADAQTSADPDPAGDGTGLPADPAGTAPGPGAGGAVTPQYAAFCESAVAIWDGMAQVTIGNDPAGYVASVGRLDGQTQAVSAPAEIAGAWTTFQRGSATRAEQVAALDTSNPKSFAIGLATMQQEPPPGLDEATTTIDAFLRTHCGY